MNFNKQNKSIRGKTKKFVRNLKALVILKHSDVPICFDLRDFKILDLLNYFSFASKNL